jgi:hypothetical protein
MVTAISLMFLAVICRLFSAHFAVWNFVPMGALSLYAGARLPRRWAWTVPVAAMILSDLVLDFGTNRAFAEPTRWIIYGIFATIALLGPLANRPRIGPFVLPVLSLSASMLFFLASNFGVWTEGLLYPRTFSGLAACYVAAIPFFGGTVLADLVGTGLLFGLGALIERAARRSASARPLEAPFAG